MFALELSHFVLQFVFAVNLHSWPEDDNETFGGGENHTFEVFIAAFHHANLFFCGNLLTCCMLLGFSNWPIEVMKNWRNHEDFFTALKHSFDTIQNTVENILTARVVFSGAKCKLFFHDQHTMSDSEPLFSADGCSIEYAPQNVFLCKFCAAIVSFWILMMLVRSGTFSRGLKHSFTLLNCT